MGYDAIEPWLPAYEADDGKSFRKALDAAGLKCFGFHMPFTGLVGEPQRFIDIALTLGAQLDDPALYRAGGSRHDGRLLARGRRQAAGGADKAKAAGLKVAWHNHDFEFVPLADGSRPIDHILRADTPDVWFEIDCGWIVRAKADPAAELRQIQGSDRGDPDQGHGAARHQAGRRLGGDRRRHHRLGERWCRCSGRPKPTTSSPSTTIRAIGSNLLRAPSTICKHWGFRPGTTGFCQGPDGLSEHAALTAFRA